MHYKKRTLNYSYLTLNVEYIDRTEGCDTTHLPVNFSRGSEGLYTAYQIVLCTKPYTVAYRRNGDEHESMNRF